MMSTVVDENESGEISPLAALSRDLKAAAATLTAQEARFLVDHYYMMQGNRIRAENQARAMRETEEPHAVLTWLWGNTARLEKNLVAVFERYADAHTVGRWSLSIVGIGPVLSAGLLAHIDITKARTVGHIWSFAGMEPTQRWLGSSDARLLVENLESEIGDDGDLDDVLARAAVETGRSVEALTVLASNEDGPPTREGLIAALAKRPWNASLKVLGWKIGESFKKVSNHPKDVYGHLYRVRKDYENRRNDAGELAAQAVEKLQRVRIGKNTDAYAAYSQGRLPRAHIDRRAARWATKMFLSHWHEVAYFAHYGELPPIPYAMAVLGHDRREYLPVPNAELVPGLVEAHKKAGPERLDPKNWPAKP